MMPGGLAMLLMMPVAGKLSSHVGPKYLISFGLAVIALAMWHSTSLAPRRGLQFLSWGAALSDNFSMT